MTPHPRYNRALWATLAGSVAAIWLVLHCASCGPSETAARQAARSAAYVIQSLCAPSATVQECTDTLLENAEYLNPPDGGAGE